MKTKCDALLDLAPFNHVTQWNSTQLRERNLCALWDFMKS